MARGWLLRSIAGRSIPGVGPSAQTLKNLKPMKRIHLGLLLAVLSTGASAATSYRFDELSQQRQPVPADVNAVIKGLASEDIEDCQEQLGLTAQQMQSYFTAHPVNLPGSKAQAVLVLPTQYCYAFFGAHAMSFWLFLVEPSGLRLVLSNRQDALEVKGTTRNGLPEISTYYGASETKYRFDGEQYVALPE